MRLSISIRKSKGLHKNVLSLYTNKLPKRKKLNSKCIIHLNLKSREKSKTMQSWGRHRILDNTQNARTIKKLITGLKNIWTLCSVQISYKLKGKTQAKKNISYIFIYQELDVQNFKKLWIHN
jgi:hypothetical protein